MDIIKNIIGAGKNSNRTFTINKIYNTNYTIKNGGRYRNDKPQEAARKAFRKVLEKDNIKYISFDIEMRETTRGSNKKIYKYTFTRLLRKTPKIIIRDNKKITYKWKFISKYIPKPKYIKILNFQEQKLKEQKLKEQKMKKIPKFKKIDYSKVKSKLNTKFNYKPPKKSKRYICSEKEKNDKFTKVCCNKTNTINERTYKTCVKNIKRFRK